MRLSTKINRFMNVSTVTGKTGKTKDKGKK